MESAELKNQRLKEVFQTKIQEFRKVCYALTGYQIDITTENQYRLTSMYAEHKADCLIFKVGPAVTRRARCWEQPRLRQAWSVGWEGASLLTLGHPHLCPAAWGLLREAPGPNLAASGSLPSPCCYTGPVAGRGRAARARASCTSRTQGTAEVIG